MPEKFKGKGLIVLGGWMRLYLTIIAVVFFYATLTHDSNSNIHHFLPAVISDLIIRLSNYGPGISVFGDNYSGFAYALWEGIASAIVIGILLLVGGLLVQWIIAGFKRQ